MKTITIAKDDPDNFLRPAMPPLSPAARQILCPQNMAGIVRAAKKSLASARPEPIHLMEAISKCLLTKCEGARFSDEILATTLREVVQNGFGKINAVIDANKARTDAHPDLEVPLNGTTVASRLPDLTLAEAEVVMNALLTMVANLVLALLPDYIMDANLDEVLIDVWGKTIRPDDKDDYMRYSIGSGKEGSKSDRVLHWNVACITIPELQIKIPIWMSLYCGADKQTGEYHPDRKCPTKAAVVKEFLQSLHALDRAPRWIFMDRGFVSYDALGACVRFKKVMKENDHVVDFVIPAVRWGQARPEMDEIPRDQWINYQPISARRQRIEGAATISDLVQHGDRIANVAMKGHVGWKYRAFEFDTPDGPDGMIEGLRLLVVNAPRPTVKNGVGTLEVMQDAGGIEVHADDSRSFATWTTARVTPNTAHEVVTGYNRRGWIERVIQDMRARFRGIPQTPDIGKRAIGMGLSLIFLGAWAFFRTWHGLQTGRWNAGDYPLVYFLNLIDPALPRSLLATLRRDIG